MVEISLAWPDAERVVPRPKGPIAALRTITRDQDELYILLSIEAITNPLAREAVGVLKTIPLARRYTGPRADLVMTPFLLPRESRFSSGVFGVLYAAEDIDTALRESGHHQGQRLTAMSAPVSTTVPMYSLSPSVNATVVDARQPGVDAAIHDPSSYAASRALGRKIRADGHEGLVYSSVRNPGGACVALFWPDAVSDVRDGYEWRFYQKAAQCSSHTASPAVG